MSSRSEFVSRSIISNTLNRSKKGAKTRAPGVDKLEAAFKPVLENLESRQMLSAGSPDASFNLTGKQTFDSGFQDLGRASLVEPNGKILVAGESQSRFALTQYDTNGSLDGYSLNTGASVPFSSYSAIALQGGKILVAGTLTDPSNGDSEFAVSRYDNVGSIDATFGDNGTAVTDLGNNSRDIAYGVAVQSDGKIVVVGSTGNVGQEDVALVRYSADGVLDKGADGFGADHSGIVVDGNADSESANAVAISADDKIVIVGKDGNHTLIRRYNADGTFDVGHTQNIAGTDQASAVTVQGNGFVVSGTAGGDFYAARFDESLTLDSAFGNAGVQTVDFGGTDSASSMAIAPDGKIVLGGTTTNGASGSQDFAVARLNADGSIDNSFGTGGKTTVDFNGHNDVGTAVGVTADRKIVLAGYTAGTNDNDFAVARLEGNSAPAIATTPANFDAINEDDAANNGTSVSDLAARLGVSDADNDSAGLAITGMDLANGSWEYSTDGGANWNSIGAVTADNALLLSSDAQNRLRFVPAADFNTASGTAPALSVVAWDGTVGTSGATADTTDNSAHQNAFGDAGELDQAVTAVNDAPSFEIGADQTALTGAGRQTISGWAKNMLAGPANENGQTLSFEVTELTDPNNAISDVSIDPVSGDLTFTAANSAGAATFSVVLKDNGGGTDTSAAQTFSINVQSDSAQTWVNDNWQITNDVGAAGLSLGDTVANTGTGDDGTVSGKTFGIDAFSSIQDGVDFTAAGGIEHVISGSYAENVIVNKALELAGDGQSSTTIVPAISGANTGGGSLGDGVSSVILVQSDDVTIHDLTIDGDNTSLTGAASAVVNGADIDARNGIITDHVSGVYNNLDVHNTTVRNIYLRGIYASSGGTFDFSNNTVDNVAGDEASIGIFNFAGSGNISGNTVTRTNDAISANHSLGTTFTGNHISQSLSGIHSDNAGDGVGSTPDVISGNDVSNGGEGSYGIWVFVPYNSVAVENNTISGVDVGLAAFGGVGGEADFNDNIVSVNSGGMGAYITTDQLGFGAGNVVASLDNNQISGGDAGVYVETTDGIFTATASVSNGSITGAAVGVQATAGSNVDVSGVAITGNGVGIDYSGGAGGAVVNNDFEDAGGNNNGTDLQLESDAGNITGGAVTGNTFAGNDFYIVNLSPQNLTALASSNNYRESGGPETDNFEIEDKIYHKLDNAASGLVTWVAGNLFVTPTTNPTATDNDYTRLANAVALAQSGDTITLKGTFDWTEANAHASWALGNDGIAGDADDYSLYMPSGLNNLTITATSLGQATIQGPGDLPDVNLEGVFVFDGGQNQNTTISNLQINDFDLSIAFFNGAGGTHAFDDTHIVNNHIKVASDLNATVAPVDVNQNIGIHYSFGLNQVIQNNIIDLAGDAVSDSASGNMASEVGIQSNTSGGGVYDGLLIDGNTINVIGAQSADPVSIMGIWENGHAHDSNITVSNNKFINTDPDNNPLLNLQKAFRITSHSSATSSVLYSGNSVVGANIGFQWIAGSDFSGNSPVELIGNVLTNVATGVLLQSNGSAHLSANTFTNTGGMDGKGIAVDVTSGSSVTIDSATALNEITGFGTGVRVAGSADISNAKIRGGDVGIELANSGTATIKGVNFDGSSANNNKTDLKVDSGAGALTVGAGNEFAGDTFYIDNHSAQDIDLSGKGTTFDETDNYRIEDKMFHKMDDVTKGLVTWVAGNLFVTKPEVGSTDSDIQRAIDIASAGSTVNIENGTYKQPNIAVDKALTIAGQSRNGVVIAPSIADGHVDDNFTDVSDGFVIGASGVSIKNLTIDGNANTDLAGVQNFRNGIITDYTNGDFGDIAVDNVSINNIFRKGIGFYVTNNNKVSGDSVSNSSFDNIGTDASLGFEGYAAIAAFQSDTTISNVIITGSGAGIATNYFTTEANAPKLTISGVNISNMHTDGTNPIVGMDLSGLADGSSISENQIDVSGGNADIGIVVQYAASGADVTVSGNTIKSDAGDTGLLLYQNVNAAHPTIVSGNTFTGDGSGTGILVTDDGSVFGESPNVGTTYATLSGNTISDYGTGISVSSAGSTPVSITLGTGNTISGGVTGLAVSGANAAIAGNSLSDLAFDEQSGQYIVLSNGALDNQEIDATGVSFDGVTGATASDAQNFAIEDKITHAVDDLSLGFVRVKLANVFVTTNSGSIQRGVDVASTGDIVNVGDGTYVEQVDIGKDLTLKGQSQAGAIIKSPAALANSFVWSGITYKPVVIVHDANVNVEQLTVDGDGQGAANNRFTGIGYHNAGGTVDHTTVIGVRDSVLDGVQHGYGIIGRNDDAVTTTLNITNNTVSDFQKNGIDVRGSGLTANISDNTVTGAGETAVIAQNGIVVVNSLAHIAGNTVSGNEYSGPGAGADPLNDTQSIGILLTPAGDGSTVDGNFVDGNDIGIYSLGNNITVSNNQLGNTSANRYEGILVDQGSTTLDGNTIKGGNIGVAVIAFDGNTGDSAATLTNNTITDAETGVLVVGGNLTIGSGNLISGGTTGLAIDGTNSAITSSSLGNLAFDEQSGQYIVLSNGALDNQEIDATAAIFDGVTGATATLAQNFAIEDKITHAVDDTSLGLVRVKAGNVFVTTNSGSIQRGVDVASTGDTVNVGDGTYVEQVDIEKDLTLRGQNQAGTIIQSPASLEHSFVWSGITYKPVIMAQNANVNIERLTVDGDGQGNTNNRFTGIGYYNAGGTVDHTTVTGVRDSTLDGVQHGYGIIARNDDSTSRTINISSNTVLDYQKNGIDVRGSKLTANITNNTVTGAGDTSVIAQNGIVVIDALAHVTGNTVSGNEYSGNGAGADPLNDTQSIGILLTPAGDGTTVDGNIVDGNDIGIYSLGNDISLSNNQLGNNAANRYEGILVDQGSTTLDGNAVKGGAIGIAVIAFDGNTGPSAATLTNNTITDADTGIRDIGGTLTVGSGNLISGGTTGLAISGSSAAITGKTLSNLAFDEQSGQYIALSDNALDNQVIDATSVTFDGVNGATATNAQLAAIEAKIFHQVDDPTLGLILVKTPDTTAPTVVSSVFHFENAPQRITIQFSENVKDSLSLDDITLVNTLTGDPIDASNMTLTYDDATNTATITFHDLPRTGTYLGTGKYELTVNSAGVTDQSGNPLDGDGSGGNHVLDFFQLEGDANRDQTVNFDDLVAVAQHYEKNPGSQTWATGDFNYDGKVDFADLVTVAQNYGKTLLPPPAPAPVAAAPVAAPAPSASPVVSSSPVTTPVVAAAPVVAPVVSSAPVVATAKAAAPVVVSSSAKVIAPSPVKLTQSATAVRTTSTKTVIKTATVAKPKTVTPVAKPAVVKVNAPVKTVVKTKATTGVTPIQSSANAPFAVQTRLRTDNRKTKLVGDVLGSQTNKTSVWK